MSHKFFVSIVLLFALLIPAALVIAQPVGYIQINNGSIVTNEGQQFQVVSQFGNRGNETLHNVAVICLWPARLGTLGNVYSGPFSYFDSVPGAVSGGSDVFGFIIDDVDLPPRQNYNFSFNIHVTAPRGTSSSVTCQIGSSATVPGNGTLVDQDSALVYVQ